MELLESDASAMQDSGALAEMFLCVLVNGAAKWARRGRVAETRGGAPGVKNCAENCHNDIGGGVPANRVDILDGAGSAELRVGEVTGEPPGEKRVEVDGVVDTGIFLDDGLLKVGALS